MKTSIRVSIVLPVFNGKKFLQAALLSIESQTVPPMEVVIVDDCSTDGGLVAAVDFKRRVKFPVSLLSTSINSGGPSRPINIGVNAARGDWILVLDQDDLLSKNALENIQEVLSSSPDVGALVHKGVDLQSDQLCDQQVQLFNRYFETAKTSPQESVVISPQTAELLPIELGMFAVGYPGFIFAKSLWKERPNGVDEKLAVAGDLDFLSWICKKRKILLLNRVGFYKRLHPNRVCSSKTNLIYESVSVLMRFFCSLPQSQQRKIRMALMKRLKNAYYYFRGENDHVQARQVLLNIVEVLPRGLERIRWRSRLWISYLK